MRQPQKFEVPSGAEWTECRSCHEKIVWVRTKRGRAMPVNEDGTSHFATCPDANEWRNNSRRSKS